MLATPDVKKAFDKYFVTVPLIVMESPQNKVRENPGGDKVMEKNGGKGAGLPFFYFADAKGNQIINSIRPGDSQNLSDKGGNIGCPYEPQEIFWFVRMLVKAAPKMSDEDRTTIQKGFEALKKADGG